jgi:F420-non-reducing hydrogenase small subunit
MARSKGEELFGTLFDKGVVVTSQGEPGDTMYIIQSGNVEVVQEKDETETVLAQLGQGEFFGEMALIGDFPRTATVRTLSRCRLLPITRSSLLNRAQSDTSVVTHLLEIVIHRIVRTNRILSSRIEEDDAFYEKLKKKGHVNIGEIPYSQHDISPTDQKTDQLPHEMVLNRFTESYGEGSRISLDPGEILFKEGDAADLMYVILEGRIRISHGEGKNKHTLAILAPGDIFGEMALITHLPRSATAEAMEAAELIPVVKKFFLDQVGKEPGLALHLLQLMIVRLRRTLAMMQEPDAGREFAPQSDQPTLQVNSLLKIALVSLSSCGGCMVRLIEEENLSSPLGGATIIYSTLLMDQEEIVPCDIAVVDGAVRVMDDIETLKIVRDKARYVVAWGTCAVSGGIPVLANQHTTEELIEETFSKAQDTFGYYLSDGNLHSGAVIEMQRELSLLRRASGVDSHIRIDYYLPGCPPEISLLSRFVDEISGNPADGAQSKIVCNQCERKVVNNQQNQIRVFPDKSSQSGTCFTSQGVLCLGFLTAGECGAACPSGGLPCWGCRGLSISASKKISRGDSHEQVLIESLAKRFKLSYEDVKKAVNVTRNRGNCPLNFEPETFSGRGRVR